MQLISGAEPGLFRASGFSCRFVRPPRGFAPPDGVTVVDRLGQQVRVTTVERTLADLFDRVGLAGGAEELFNSLDLVMRVDAETLVRHARGLRKASLAGALGFWLEREQAVLGVPDAVIGALRTLMPTQPRYALGARPGEGRMAPGWNVILPAAVVENRFEGL